MHKKMVKVDAPVLGLPLRKHTAIISYHVLIPMKLETSYHD